MLGRNVQGWVVKSAQVHSNSVVAPLPRWGYGWRGRRPGGREHTSQRVCVCLQRVGPPLDEFSHPPTPQAASTVNPTHSSLRVPLVATGFSPVRGLTSRTNIIVSPQTAVFMAPPTRTCIPRGSRFSVQSECLPEAPHRCASHSQSHKFNALLTALLARTLIGAFPVLTFGAPQGRNHRGNSRWGRCLP